MSILVYKPYSLENNTLFEMSIFSKTKKFLKFSKCICIVTTLILHKQKTLELFRFFTSNSTFPLLKVCLDVHHGLIQFLFLRGLSSALVLTVGSSVTFGFLSLLVDVLSMPGGTHLVTLSHFSWRQETNIRKEKFKRHTSKQ